MASGCIIHEKCPVCGDIIWEDQWDIVGDTFVHDTCRREYIKKTLHISDTQFTRLYGIEEIREEIEQIRKAAYEFKEWAEARADELEQKLDALGARKTP